MGAHQDRLYRPTSIGRRQTLLIRQGIYDVWHHLKGREQAMRILLALGGLTLITGCSSANPPAISPSLSAFAQNTLELEKYQSASIDLNGDGTDEHIIRTTDRGWCGSGGCSMWVIQEVSGNYEVVSKTSITRLPLRVLETSTNGWRDLSVIAKINASIVYEAKLPFDGTSYATNPSVEPAVRIDDSSGEILIERTPLRPEQLSQ